MRVDAAVLRGLDEPYRLETVELAEPGPGEVLVRIAGAGICHTDAMLRAGLVPLPVIGGHEGSGVVERVGSGVTTVVEGDHVVLSFDSCGDCVNCRDAHPAYCTTMVARNITGTNLDGSTPARDARGEPVHARWFQQSSFATYALATERNVIVVDRELPIELLGPLGCGVQTGAGTVFNSLRVRPGDGVVIFGAGAVGLSAVMAARVAGASTIVAVDVHQSRLDLATELGATHTVAGNGADVGAAVREATDSVRYGIDTTGLPSVISTAIGCLRPGGTLALVGIQQGDLTLGPMDLAAGRNLMGILEGDSVPQQLIPALIELWQQGRFPFDKLITTFPLAAINEAEKAAQHGEVIKPVLLPDR
jgi:aryl-alcohol dehydrogenase